MSEAPCAPTGSTKERLAFLQHQIEVLWAKEKAEEDEAKWKAEMEAAWVAAAEKAEAERAEKEKAEKAEAQKAEDERKAKVRAENIRKHQTLVVEVPKRKGKKRAKSDTESEAQESEVKMVQVPEKSGSAVSCERCADRSLWCAWPEKKTKQKSCMACAEAKAACWMPGAETKEPRKRRKVEGSEKPARRSGVTKSGDDRVSWVDAEIIFGQGFSEVAAAIREGNQALRDGLEELRAEGKRIRHQLRMESAQLRGSLDEVVAAWAAEQEETQRTLLTGKVIDAVSQSLERVERLLSMGPEMEKVARHAHGGVGTEKMAEIRHGAKTPELVEHGSEVDGEGSETMGTGEV
jgi:colicin import membrane protein